MNWFIKNKRDNLKALEEVGDLAPFDRILLANRDIRTKEEADRFLNPRLEDLHDPFLFTDMHRAVDLISDILSSDGRIRVIGDYDQDGVAATTILVRGLREFARQMGRDSLEAVDYAIPDRIEDGYGININLVDEAKSEGIRLIITCDNGISAFDAIDHARSLGIATIITDHHQILMKDGEEVLPAATAILNPHSRRSGYPFPDLCGAGVAYKLIQACTLALGYRTEDTLPLLQFAALGTICDVVPLKDENRVIVRYGLDRLNEKPNLGIRLLLDLNHWDREITVYTVGFIIGPCINASGRLFTARLGVELFLERDRAVAENYAAELIRLNEERKEMTRLGLELAVEMAAGKTDQTILFFYIPELHESICGLIAGRIKEKYHKPCLVFTDAEALGDAEEGRKLLKGSGRSIEAYNMYEELNRYRDRYFSFGGHEMACGLSLYRDELDRLEEQANQDCRLTDRDMEPYLELEMPLDLHRLDYSVIKAVDRFAPFGKDNPTPNFGVTGCNVRAFRLVGKNKNVLQIVVEKAGRRFQAVMFQGDEKLDQLRAAGLSRELDDLLSGREIERTIDLVYRPDLNEYKGKTSIQLMVQDFRFSGD